MEDSRTAKKIPWGFYAVAPADCKPGPRDVGLNAAGPQLTDCWGDGKRMLLCAFGLLLASSLVGAQGLLPPKTNTREQSLASAGPVQIGDVVPGSLTVTSTEGKSLPLLTYKGSVDDMVVVFLSARCATDQRAWPALRRFYEDYKDWHVAFLGISADSGETLSEVQKAAVKAGLVFPIARDEDRTVVRAFGVTATPEVLMLDEWSHLRYRGAMDRGMGSAGGTMNARLVRAALNTIIGHTEAVKTPQPEDTIGCPIQ